MSWETGRLWKVVRMHNHLKNRYQTLHYGNVLIASSGGTSTCCSHSSKLRYELLSAVWLPNDISNQLDAYVLPVLQGYFQIAKFHLPLPTDDASIPLSSTVANSVLGNPTQPTIEVEYASISRRSRDRAGLRYQRRGIDDDSHVANFVETEAIVRVIVSQCYNYCVFFLIFIIQREETENVFSFVQIRGSSKVLLAFI